MERKVNPIFLDKGQFVARLSRPWIDTPFWMQGFIITSEEELQALRKYCDYAYIDTNRGTGAEFYMEADMELPSNPGLEEKLSQRSIKGNYPVKLPLQQAIHEIIAMLRDVTIKFHILLEDIKNSQKVDMGKVEDIIVPIINAIANNVDAIVLVSNLKDDHAYPLSHPISGCILATVLGQYLGLGRGQLKLLACGVLLKDIGNIKVPNEILNKAGMLEDMEYREVQKHVYYGMEILKNSPGVSEHIVNVALTHHERFDGTGYLNGLKGLNIPVYGRIASIVDCYDAMTRKRPHSEPSTPHAAIQNIFSWRNKMFQDELVDYFMKCLGTYPNGSLVELTTGEVALVVAQNTEKKLKPIIVPLYDENKNFHQQLRMVDLSKVKAAKGKKAVSILRDIQPSMYEIDLNEIYAKLDDIVAESEDVSSGGGLLSKFKQLVGK